MPAGDGCWNEVGIVFVNDLWEDANKDGTPAVKGVTIDGGAPLKPEDATIFEGTRARGNDPRRPQADDPAIRKNGVMSWASNGCLGTDPAIRGDDGNGGDPDPTPDAGDGAGAGLPVVQPPSGNDRRRFIRRKAFRDTR